MEEITKKYIALKEMLSTSDVYGSFTEKLFATLKDFFSSGKINQQDYDEMVLLINKFGTDTLFALAFSTKLVFVEE